MRRIKSFLFLSLLAANAFAGSQSWFFQSGIQEPDAIKNDIQFWFRATNGVTKDGSDLVSQWDDKSSNAYNATSSGNHTPLWTANVANGKPCLYFDGASGATDDDFLQFATGIDLFANGSARSYFGTIQSVPKSGTWYNALVTLTTSTTNQNFAIASSNDSTYGNFWFGSFNASVGIQSALADVSTSVTNFRLRYTGGIVASTGSWALSLANSSQTLINTVSLGSPGGNHNYIGNWTPTGSSLSWKGYICELGGFISDMSPTQEGQINAYQTSYWGN